MQEKGPRPLLTKQDRFFVLHAEIGKEDLWAKVNDAIKDPKNDIFSPNFGRAQFDTRFDGLKARGIIKEVFVITEQGREDLIEYNKRRMRRPQLPVQMPLAAQISEEVRRIPEKPVFERLDQPVEKIVPVLKKKPRVLHGLGELGNFKVE